MREKLRSKLLTSTKKTFSKRQRHQQMIDPHGYPRTNPTKVPIPTDRDSESERDSRSAVAESDSDVGVLSPLANVAVVKNMNNVDADFRIFHVDRQKRLMYRRISAGRRRYLHGSRVRKYSYVNPSFYHSNIAVRDISTSELVGRLASFQSINPLQPYLAASTHLTVGHAYRRCFTDVDSEATLSKRFAQLVAEIVGVAKQDESQFVKDGSDRYAAATGFLCRRRSNSDDVIDEDAGYMGKTDAVLFFGSPEERMDDVACAIEFKYLKTPGLVAGHRWMTVSGALLAQILQSMVGHDAPVALAMTEQGYKIFFKELDPCGDESTLIYAWPPGPDFHIPLFGQGAVDEGLGVLAHVVRIATRKGNDENADQTSIRQTTPSSPRSPISGAEAQIRKRYPRSMPIKPPTGTPRKQRGDVLLKIKRTDGTLTEVSSLCLASRFSEAELEEIDRIEQRCSNKRI